MSRRLQVVLTDETWRLVEALGKEANQRFELGHITYSDVINEMILCSKPDLRQLQSKHTSVRKSLLLLSTQKGMDLDSAIKALTDLRARSKKPPRSQSDQESLG
jgi:hypothetical protein